MLFLPNTKRYLIVIFNSIFTDKSAVNECAESTDDVVNNNMTFEREVTFELVT
jgi:hypothetical protein